jgi:eukaryotic-like serine/threonine-protein kinase
MKTFASFFVSRSFFKNLIIALLLGVALLYAIFKSLDVYTLHGETITVPDFKGKKVKELNAFIQDKKVRYQIIDSSWIPDQKPGIVIRQDPEPKDSVKDNKIIYLYVTSIAPPQMEMPKLVDRSLRQAKTMIESYGLKLGTVTSKADMCRDCVLEQLYKGKTIDAGTKIPKGAKIDLVVGEGNGSGDVPSDSTDTNDDDDSGDM